MKKFSIFILSVFTLSLVISSLALSYEPGKKYQLTFYHVNDTHGAFYKSSVTNEGGFAILSTLVKNARKEASQAKSLFFLTSGGDVNTGTPESDLLFGEPDFRSMHFLGFDAMAVGNHEFDRNWEHLFVQQAWAQFPFLAANIRGLFAQPLPIIPYIIKEEQGLKIAFLGLATEETPFLTLPSNTKGLAFDPSIETAKKWVPFLNQRADIVVVLSHLGWCALGTCASPNDVFLARSVPGIDLILGGHSHSALAAPDYVNGTYIFQAFEKNQKVGILHMEFLDDKLTLKNSELKTISGEEDPNLLAILNPLIQSFAGKLKVVVGETSVFLDGERTNIRFKETNLGNLVTKSVQYMTSSDIAILNSGGIRASIPAGNITYGDIFKVLPFSNTICTVELTGNEIKTYMEKIALLLPGGGNFPQMSGVSLTTDVENKILSLKINNQDIQDSKVYKIAMNNFMAEGMESYPKVSNLSSFLNTGITMDAALRTYIEKHKVINAKDIEVTGYYQRAH